MGVHANIADRIGIMYAGKIVEEAPTEKIFGEPLHPYTQFLINSLPKFGDKSQRDSVPGSPPSLANLPSGCPFHPRCPHVMDICKQQMPGFTQIEPSHKVACWLVGEGERKTMETSDKLLEVDELTKVFSWAACCRARTTYRSGRYLVLYQTGRNLHPGRRKRLWQNDHGAHHPGV